MIAGGDPDVARILFACRDDAGSLAPVVGIGAALRRRGHDVRVLGHGEQYGAVNRAGLGFAVHQVTTPLQTPATESQWLRTWAALPVDPRPGVDMGLELARRPPDLVVVDAAMLAALKVATRSGVPTVALVPTFHRYLSGAWARGPMGLAATLRRLRPVKLWSAAGRVLVAADERLDALDSPAANVRHVGAVLGPVRPPAREPDPLVLVSLGTAAHPVKTAVLQRVLDGLAPLDVRVIVSTGDGVDTAALEVPDGVEVRENADHSEVMSRAHLFVGQGGHGSTMRALINGLPVLALPLHPQLDHRAIATAVADAGAGKVVAFDAEPDVIGAAAGHLLGEGSHHAAAAQIGMRLRDQDGAVAAADELELLLPKTDLRKS